MSIEHRSNKCRFVLLLVNIVLLSLIKGAAAAKTFTSQVAALVEEEKGDFSFMYTVSYPLSGIAKFPLRFFRVDLRHNPTEYPLAQRDWPDGFSYLEYREKLDGGSRVFPIGKSSPGSWDHEHVFKKPLHGWWSCPIESCSNEISLGESLSGFKIIAVEPPGIRQYLVSASGAEELKEHVGKTIAPVVPPDPFTIKAWLSRMLSDTREARKLDWIKTDEQLAKIESLIEALNVSKKRKLKRAIRDIESYIKKELKSGRLTSEADALVRLNALYLLRRVKEDSKILQR